MAKRQRTSETDPVRGTSFFEQQREALLNDISMVGNEFSSVEALWSQFESVMAKDGPKQQGDKVDAAGDEAHG
ncbi:DASH complex, subunit Dad1 [Metarhizium album ARSEF 1941]|uniref:DASH complex subunit DAD1 n=1 Tax=Metarhizium album (strain ARSEF 1941) TaxID=1081103 RepID=A0A0B2X6E5_METAS|nr:DASH complex, subunit Dad1 [Metarhizium album ARSEF 1941]KHO01964.1 DASH complex, subunit Dad1 [Metarhizium album ARSEF 1941]